MFTMTKIKKRYSSEFKEYVCKMIVQDGRKNIDISKELSIPYDTLAKWLSAYKKKMQEAEQNRQAQLRTAGEYKEMYEETNQQLLEAQEEIEILKKAMHIFTQETK